MPDPIFQQIPATSLAIDNPMSCLEIGKKHIDQVRFDLLMWLIKLIVEVSQLADVNKMTVENLGILFLD